LTGVSIARGGKTILQSRRKSRPFVMRCSHNSFTSPNILNNRHPDINDVSSPFPFFSVDTMNNGDVRIVAEGREEAKEEIFFFFSFSYDRRNKMSDEEKEAAPDD